MGVAVGDKVRIKNVGDDMFDPTWEGKEGRVYHVDEYLPFPVDIEFEDGTTEAFLFEELEVINV